MVHFWISHKKKRILSSPAMQSCRSSWSKWCQQHCSSQTSQRACKATCSSLRVGGSLQISWKLCFCSRRAFGSKLSMWVWIHFFPLDKPQRHYLCLRPAPSLAALYPIMIFQPVSLPPILSDWLDLPMKTICLTIWPPTYSSVFPPFFCLFASLRLPPSFALDLLLALKNAV